jgi:hypothetical protein
LLVLEAGEARQEITVPLDSAAFAELRGGSLSLQVEELTDQGQPPLHLLIRPAVAAAPPAERPLAPPVLSGFELTPSADGGSASLRFRADINGESSGRDHLQLVVSQRASANSSAVLSSQSVALLDASVQPTVSAQAPLSALAPRSPHSEPVPTALALDNDQRDNGQVSTQLDLSFTAAVGEPLLSVVAGTRSLPLLLRSIADDYSAGAITIDGVNLGSTREAYAVRDGADAPLEVSYPYGKASDSNPGQGWLATAAARTATGYAFYWRNSASQEVARWNLNASGAYESGYLLSPGLLLSEEASIRFDLNGDGYTNYATINGLSGGMTSLGYALKPGNLAPIQVTYPGGNVTPTNPSGLIPVAAVSSAGGYSIYLRNSATQEVELWSLNASGARTAVSTLTSAQLASEEAALNRDLNADGIIAVSLSSTPGGYVLLSAGQAPIAVTYPGGNASASNPGNNWSATAAATDNSGYTLYWSNSNTQQTARWSLDASGVYTEGSLLSPTQLFTEEVNLRRDLNGDGFVAGSSTVNGLNLGNTALGYALQTGPGTTVQVSWTGGLASANNPGNGWVATAAAPSGSGTSLYWSNSASQQVARWSLDASGAYQTGTFLSIDGLYSEEASLNADLNRDGITGAAFSTIESQGNTTLLRRNDGKAYVEAGGNRTAVQSPFNLGAGDNSSTWQMLSAETVAGTNQIAWRNNAQNILHVWSLDAGWNWQASSANIDPRSAAALGLETSFGVDLNGDRLIGEMA